MIAIDDILENLRNEQTSLDDALTEIGQRLKDKPQEADSTALLDRVDQLQQAGLPAAHATAVRDFLLDKTMGGDASASAPEADSADDDMMELSLEPSEEPARPVSGYDITDGTEPPPAGESPAEPPAEETPSVETPPTEDAPTADTADDDAASDDHGLPPISPFAQDNADSDATSGGTDDPPELDDTVPTTGDAEQSGGKDEHEVVMETRGDLPSSSERYERPERDHSETISERAVTTTTIIGALLGGRFELLTRISQDPYGTVYRARDHEKDDSNPEAQLCGVRVLPSRLAQQDMVTKRVEAITKRIGRLKHPGILKPIALHRDEGQAWVVTELPVGSTLARFIRRECVEGLPAQRALTLVRRIGEAIASAHERGIPHGDLKPNSIFIGEKDKIRVADFGMRTALYGNKGLSGQAGSTEIEQMDPIEAYLSLEIMEGSPPEPADDIYALGCIAACLLTGGHPFNGQSGLRRMKADTPVPKMPSLTRHQNQVLRQALAPYRNERPESVDEFLTQLETLRGKTRKLPLVIGAGVLAAVAAAWFPALDYLEQREQQHMIEDLRGTDWPAIRGALRNLEPEDRQIALDALAPDLPAQYARQVENTLADGNPLDAQALLNEALRYYPDQEALNTLQGQVAEAEEDLVEAQASGIRSLLDSGRLGLDETAMELATHFEELRRLDPQHELASHDELRPHFREAADTAADSADSDRATHLKRAAGALFPEDDPIHAHLAAAQSQAELRASDEMSNDLVPNLEARLPPRSLADVRAVETDWQQLLRITGGHPLIDTHAETAADIVNGRVREYMSAQQWGDANALLRELATILPTARLETLRQDLTRAQLNAGYRPESIRAERQALDERRERVEALLADTRMTPVWSGELIIAWRDMIAWLRPGRSWLPELREKVHTLYLDGITEYQAAGDNETAERLAREGLKVLPNSRELQEQQNALRTDGQGS